MKLNPTQQEAVDCRHDGIVVVAAPGSGKTRTVVSRVVARGATAAKRTICITFTNAAARELKERLVAEGVTMGFVGTSHGLALRLIRRFGHKVLGYREGDVAVLDEKAAAAVEAGVLSDLSLKCANLKRKVREGRASRDERLAFREYQFRLRKNNAVDYDLILTEAVELLKHATPQECLKVEFDDLMVDEFQDTSPEESELFARVPCRRFYVGDPDQCHPAGTLVRHPDGSEKPIERVEKWDRVMTYERHGKALLKNGVVNAVARRQFSGDLYSVHAGGKTVECTGNHRWLVKWSSGVQRQKALWCTYLMRKGDWFRVGKTRFFRNGPGDHVIGLALRMNQERADCGWVLKTHATDGEAIAYEQIVSATYGLPEACFWSQAGSGFTESVIREIFSTVPNQLVNAVRCLRDHGRELEFPLIDRREPRTRRTVQEIRACNLLDEVMHVPDADRDGAWTQVRVTRRPFSGEVFSLDVLPHHKYVANGLVTCNCIYQFRGSSMRNIMDAAKDVRNVVFALRQNYRSAPHICEAANRLIAHNKDRLPLAIEPVRALQGIVTRTLFATAEQEAEWVVQHFSGRGCAVLARTNEMARTAAGWFRARGIRTTEAALRDSLLTRAPELVPFVQMVADPFNDLASRRFLEECRRFETTDVLQEAGSASVPVAMALESRIVQAVKLADLRQLPQHMAKVGRFAPEVCDEAADLLEEYWKCEDEPTLGGFLAFAMSWAAEPADEDGVTITTVHGSKGREWDRVVMVGCEQEWWVKKNADVEAERRLFYVGMTRAKDVLALTSAKRRDLAWKRGAERTECQFAVEAVP